MGYITVLLSGLLGGLLIGYWRMNRYWSRLPKPMEGVCFVLCGYRDPGVIICNDNDLESWLKVACKDKPLVYTMEQWMLSDGVVVIRGYIEQATDYPKTVA